jgi:hypothetical protein
MVIPQKTKKRKIALFAGDKNMLVHKEWIDGFCAGAE